MKNTRRRSVAAAETEAQEEQVFEEMEDGFEEEEEEEEEEAEEMEDEVEEEARPELPEGFYEIEHIRKKRVKKGEVQYLVKWRDWPESANTWEPYENLASVPDVVDAFEQRMQHKSSQKRKGKSGASTSQAKRRLSSAATVSVDLVQNPSPLPFIGDGGLNNGIDSNMVDIHISGAIENNGSAVLPSQVQGEQEQNDRNVNHSEITNEVNEGNLGVDMQGWGAAEVNDHAKDGQDSVHAGHSISRRKKSAVVKRFRKDESDCRTNHTMPEDSIRVTRSRLQAEQQRHNNPVDNSGNHNDAAIIQIIKPMSFEASGPDQDVVVTFTARRSDDKEIVVDNKFLKVNNPLMLINFYEKHLKYNADMEAQV